jgi:SAM-dependent methyltransferase/ribosomal protein S18 acetylase RimI-like enzyme
MTAAEVVVRKATPNDALSVARLHAASWRRHYRGAYSGTYLDGDLCAERLSAWTVRLAAATEATFTTLAEQRGEAVGFIHLELDADPQWGALIDNLHVVRDLHDAGIGTRLLGAAAEWVAERRPTCGIFLWVLEHNTRAQAFYLARGGCLEERAPVTPPAGDPRNLTGTPFKVRVAWSDTGALSRQSRRDRAQVGRPGEASVRAAYDSVAREYDAAIGDELDRKPLDRALLGAFLQLAGAGLVFDLGCGPGHTTRFARGLHPAVLGLDLSPEMVRIARKHDPDGGYLAASMLELPVANGLLAGAMAPYSLIHLDDEGRAAAIAELARAIRADGWLYLAFHIDSSEFAAGEVNHIADWFGKSVELEGHFLEPGAVARELEDAGFRVIANTIRQPSPGIEYPSRRCYLIAQRRP